MFQLLLFFVAYFLIKQSFCSEIRETVTINNAQVTGNLRLEVMNENIFNQIAAFLLDSENALEKCSRALRERMLKVKDQRKYNIGYLEIPELFNFRLYDSEMRHVTALADEPFDGKVFGILCDGLVYKNRFELLHVPLTKYALRILDRVPESFQLPLAAMRLELLSFARSKSMFNSLAEYSRSPSDWNYLDFESESKIFKHVFSIPLLAERYKTSPHELIRKKYLAHAILNHQSDIIELFKTVFGHENTTKNITELLDNIFMVPNVPESEYQYLFETIDSLLQADDLILGEECIRALYYLSVNNEIRFGDCFIIDESDCHVESGFYAYLAKKEDLLLRIMDNFMSNAVYTLCELDSKMNQYPEVFGYFLKIYENTNIFHGMSDICRFKNFLLKLCKHYYYYGGVGNAVTFIIDQEFVGLGYPERLQVKIDIFSCMPNLRFLNENDIFNFILRCLIEEIISDGYLIEFGEVNVKFLHI